MYGIAAALLNHLPFASYPYRGEARPCNLCGHGEATLVCRYDRRMKRLTTVRCDGCGLLRTDPMPTEAELGAYYASAYRGDYQLARRTPPRLHLKRSRRESEARMALLAPLLRPASHILDFGSGSGEFLDLATKAGHSATGIEPGRDFARYAREAYGADVHIGPWTGIDLPEGGFDLITARHVLEHLRDPVDALRRMADWLAPDGVIHVEVPNAEAIRKDALQQFHFAHIHHFSPTTLAHAGAKAGLEADPRFPGEGTTMVFRKRQADTPVMSAAGVMPAVDPRLARLTPFTHLASGIWAESLLRRMGKAFADLGPRLPPPPRTAHAAGIVSARR